jgi:phosphoenolpyruvate synthase/pyruvate phosphate dikinase
MSKYIRFFSDLTNQDTAEVGGKNASFLKITPAKL